MTQLATACEIGMPRSRVGTTEPPFSLTQVPAQPAISCAVAKQHISQSPLLTPLHSRLPSLANSCYLVGQAKRADLVWSRGDFLALCEHMLNGNQSDHFLSAWVDSQTARACFCKALPYKRADKRASWSWDTITEKAKVKTSIGFYPLNREGLTRWAAIDFDAHNGEFERARRWSLGAFSLLLTHPNLYLVLCTSGGGGFHLFIFTREFHTVGEWIILLKQVCQWLGAPISDGVCEIFPNEKAESQRVGKAIRAPGTFNPKSGTCSLIEAENIRPLLDGLSKNWTLGVGKVNRNFLRNGDEVSLHKSINNYSPSTESLITDVIERHPISRKGMRNGVLMTLVGNLSHKFGFQKAREIVELHYHTYENNIGTPLAEHIREFEGGWQGQVENVRERFTPTEKTVFDSLRSDNQRDGFRIVWAFARAAALKGEPDFRIVRASFADRLSVTDAGASDVIGVLVDANAIRLTQPYKPHVSSARYEWICRSEN
jgi:hypothetical protein